MTMTTPDPNRRNLAHFARPKGPDLLGRTAPILDWVTARVEQNTWPFARTMRSPLRPVAEIEDVTGRAGGGLNFASQDYLGLSTHPDVVEAAVDAARSLGLQSGGSGALTGSSVKSRALEQELSDLIQMEQVMLFPTGWAAGFGAIVGLVRHYDHIIMDELAHASLQQGAAAATPSVHRHAHLDLDDLHARLAKLRGGDAKGGILVITEGIYSMDADMPDLTRCQEICHEFGATLLVDQAHDLGASGPEGTGEIGLQGMLGSIDIVMGSFSKSFGTNGGFIAVNSAAARLAISSYGGSFTFSTALSPVQIAIAQQSLRIIRSPEGDRLRSDLIEVSDALRGALERAGHRCFGVPSAINPVPIGSETVARHASGLLTDRGVLANLIEFPAVRAGTSRLRMQAMATHTVEQAQQAATIVAATIDEVSTLHEEKGSNQ